MAASSVSGKGRGAAFPGNKGPKNGRETFVPIHSPHVVAAGEANLVGNTKTITFPTPLEGGEADYVVMVTSKANALAYVSAKTDSSGAFASFTVTGTGTNAFGYAVIKIGVA